MDKFTTLNHELDLPCLDGFHVMDEEERSHLQMIEDGPGICLSDPERHMLISAGWKQIGGFTSMLLNSKDVAKNMEATVKKSMKQFDYRLEGFADLSIGGKKASGYRYEYKVQDVGMYGESYAVKSKKTIYYLHFYARTALKAESLSVWEECLRTLRWL